MAFQGAWQRRHGVKTGRELCMMKVEEFIYFDRWRFTAVESEEHAVGGESTS